MNKLIFMTIMLFLLASCGGGSGSGETSTTSAPGTGNTSVPSDPASTPPAEPDPVPSVTQIGETNDLVADKDFVLSASYEVVLDVDISQRVSEPTYLLVCADYEIESGIYDVDYSNCVVRSELVSGSYSGDLLLPNHTKSLVAVIWRYDESAEPEHILWNHDLNGGRFTVR